MKKILLFLFFATIIQAQTITTSAPTRLDLVHYYSDKLLLEIGVADADGIGFDFSGYTGEFKIKSAEGSSTALKTIDVSFTDSVIIIESLADSLTSLRAPRLLFYELILNDGTNDKTWLAGKFNYTNRPSSSQISSLTLAYNTESLSLAVSGVAINADIISDSLNRIDDSLAVHSDTSLSHNNRILAIIDSLNNIYTESQVNSLLDVKLDKADTLNLSQRVDSLRTGVDSLAEDVIRYNTLSSYSADQILTIDNYYVQITTSTTNKTVTLPIANIPDGTAFHIKKIDSGSGDVVVVVSGGGTIDGDVSLTIYYQHTAYTFVKSGNNYLLF